MLSARSGLGRKGEPQANAAVMIVVPHLVTLRHRAVNRPVMKATTTKHSFVAFTHERGPIGRNVPEVAGEDVLTPLPYVPRQVIDAELVRRLKRNGLRVIAVPPIIPRYRIDVVTAAKAEPVGPMWPTTGGVLPLRLGGQPERTQFRS